MTIEELVLKVVTPDCRWFRRRGIIVEYVVVRREQAFEVDCEGFHDGSAMILSGYREYGIQGVGRALGGGVVPSD